MVHDHHYLHWLLADAGLIPLLRMEVRPQMLQEMHRTLLQRQGSKEHGALRAGL